MKLNNSQETAIFDWINKIIKSCKNYEHVIITEKLIENFWRIISENNLLMIAILQGNLIEQQYKIQKAQEQLYRAQDHEARVFYDS